MRVTKSEFITSSSKVDQCPKTDKPEFAFIGRSNVGKSSLTNMLCNRKSLAKTSGSPGKTKMSNHFLINDAWHLVDLPGFGYAKVSKKDRASFMKMIYDYFEQRENMVSAFMLVDARIEPQTSDLDFMEWLGNHQVPFTIVFTKIDKLSSAELKKNLLRYKKKLLETWEEIPQIFLTSATSKHGQDEVLNYIDYCIDIWEKSQKERD
ncbi:MAG: ribosome biogenesis GTP-binding protein YihA/YsxC [Salibacteraceae bacterium]